MSTQDNLQDADGINEEQNKNSQVENSSELDESNEQISSLKTTETSKIENSTKDDSKLVKENQNESETASNIDYNDLDLEALVTTFEKLLKSDDIYAIRFKINQIKKAFNTKFSTQLKEAKDNFLAQGGNSIDFIFDSPSKKIFNALSKQFREKNESFEKNRSRTMKQNLEARLEIIEQIKSLIDVNEDSNATYNNFKNLQERWRNLGKVPAKDANNIWNNYRHHVGKFYDFLHLDRDLRERDYQYNLEQKQKIIKSAEALANEKNLGRAFRELQALHKIWKEELGPVAKEHSDSLWEQFSAASKIINDKRQDYNAFIEEELLGNHKHKENIISKIKALTSTEVDQHSEWQKRSHEVEQLRQEFLKIGAVPKKMRSKSWTDFKSVVSEFNKQKNKFYKSLKKDQSENLQKKKELVQIAEQNKDSEDFETTVVLMKDIQDKWKKIGHIPRKDSNKLWKQFRLACNHFFNRYYDNKNIGTAEENQALKDKEALLETLKLLKLGEDQESNINQIKEISSQWSSLGNVPMARRKIDSEFYNIMIDFCNKSGMSKVEIEDLKYTNKLLKLSEDPKGFNKEITFVRKKIDDISSEINQLENNLQFFSNVESDNPMVIDVQKKIEAHKINLEQWNKKLNIIKKLLD